MFDNFFVVRVFPLSIQVCVPKEATDATDSITEVTNDGEYIFELDEAHHYTRIIFSHEFAKAVYGENETCICCGSSEFKYKHRKSLFGDTWFECAKCTVEALDICVFGIQDGTTYPAWMYRLQYQVLSENPLQYMWENRRK